MTQGTESLIPWVRWPKRRPTLLKGLFGDHFQKRHLEQSLIRDAQAQALALAEEQEVVPFARLIHSDNPPSGPYGGTSLVWMTSGRRFQAPLDPGKRLSW
jgi:hypothetical protein